MPTGARRWFKGNVGEHKSQSTTACARPRSLVAFAFDTSGLNFSVFGLLQVSYTRPLPLLVTQHVCYAAVLTAPNTCTKRAQKKPPRREQRQAYTTVLRLSTEPNAMHITYNSRRLSLCLYPLPDERTTVQGARTHTRYST